ncbi:MAG: hypothetical protein ACOYOV_00200 [Bacteroidales bacterium]
MKTEILPIIGTGLLVIIIAYVVLGILYFIINSFYTDYLDDGRIPSFYRIIRDGNGNILVQRRELFGLWEAVSFRYSRKSLGRMENIEDTEENLAILMRVISDKRKDIAELKQRKYERELLLGKLKKLPKVIHTDP